MPAITAPSVIVEMWASRRWSSISLSGVPGYLYLAPNQIRMSAGANLSGFAADHEGCQGQIRHVCRALVHELGAERVLYFPDSECLPEGGGLGDSRSTSYSSG